MQAGKLEERITLQSPETVNNAGEVSTSWQDEGIVWARVISERGSEALESARTTARQLVRVLIRYRPDVQTTWRIEWGGQFYEIVALDRTMRRQGELWFTARLIGAL